ncbi:MAG: nuclear transport factor 2 family protein [Ferruginibacter sp.]|nr:nuclear transport factor 2 family protein [Ferruginibacter sp.]
MKFIYLIMFCAFCTTIQAQKKAKLQVEEAVKKLTTAMVNADSAMLDDLSSSALSYGHSGGAVEDKKAFIEKIVSGKSDFVSINITEQQITINKKVAIVRHKLDGTTNDKGKQSGEVHLKILLVWQKQNGKWKLVARQAVKNV